MVPHITRQAIQVAAMPNGMAEDGFPIFADGVLMAVVTRLERSVDDATLQGCCFLKIGFEPCEGTSGAPPILYPPDEVQAWVRERVSRARGRAQAW